MSSLYFFLYRMEMVLSRRDLGRCPIFLEALDTATSRDAISFLKVLYRRPGSLLVGSGALVELYVRDDF